MKNILTVLKVKKWGLLFLCGLVVFAVSGDVKAEIVNKNKNISYATIQEAIDAAAKGNEIEVSPGIYYEHISIVGKHIKLRSIKPNDSDVTEATIINGSNTGDVVTITNCADGEIAGLTIRNGNRGIYCDASPVKITNCIVTNNSAEGIYVNACSPEIVKCLVTYNEGIGVRCAEGSPKIEKCRIQKNGKCGIFIKGTAMKPAPKITKCWICRNGLSGCGNGIYLANVSEKDAVIRNNTIVFNHQYGIYGELGTKPKIKNCILWGNGGGELYNIDATYCCVKSGHPGKGNFDKYPCFQNVDSEDYHITPDSNCIDAGDPNQDYSCDSDFDDECMEIAIDQKPDGTVYVVVLADIGADVYYVSGADYNGDGFVNFVDYAFFMPALEGPLGNPGLLALVDLNMDGLMSISDFGIWKRDWLWQAGWTKTQLTSIVKGVAYIGEQYVASTVPQDIPTVAPPNPDAMAQWLRDLWDQDPNMSKYLDKGKFDAFAAAVQAATDPNDPNLVIP